MAGKALTRHTSRILHDHSDRSRKTLDAANAVMESFRKAQGGNSLLADFQSYLRDSAERAILATDALRKRGDIFLEHEAEGCPPVLVYDYEVVMDGADLPFPCNYMLLKITPPEGMEIKPWKRPYIIIDPRAHHRLRQPRRQHHATAAGAELDRRDLCRCLGNPHPRPAHHLHGA